MRYIIDRFEGDFAVVEKEDGSFEQILRATLPAGAQEGDIVDMGVINAETTAQKKEELKNRLNRLFEK